jgi:ABC-type proline/glycine betaine transport system permease subunit
MKMEIVTWKEIIEVVSFEKESIILAAVIAIPTGILFGLGNDIYTFVIRPLVIRTWKRVRSNRRSALASSKE